MNHRRIGLVMWLAILLANSGSNATSTSHETRLARHDQANTQEVFMEDGHQPEPDQRAAGCDKGAPRPPLGSHLPAQKGQHRHQLMGSGKSQQLHSVDEMSELWDMIMSRMNERFGSLMPMFRQMLEENFESNEQDQYQFMDDQQPEIGYELVNNRFAAGLKTGPDRGDEQTKNWQVWKNEISFNPSGKALILGHTAAKAPVHNNYTPAQRVEPTAAVKSEPVSAPPGQVVTVIEMPTIQHQESGELDRQDVAQYIAPIKMFANEQAPELVVQQAAEAKREPEESKSAAASSETRSQIVSLGPGRSAQQVNEPRIIDSLRTAADVARQLQSRAQSNATWAPSRPEPPATPTAEAGARGQVGGPVFGSSVWRTSATTSAPPDASFGETGAELRPTPGEMVSEFTEPSSGRRRDAIFLGYGQLQRIEPFNGNDRTQARLSCQFGSDDARNISISNVEWAKFSEAYDANQRDPPFDCPDEACDVSQVKTDVFTTVHPRPAVQRFVNVRVPSYSITLHDVQPRHLGVYRCSAVRQVADGRPELVYRVVAL